MPSAEDLEKMKKAAEAVTQSPAGPEPAAEGARTAKRKKEIARELATTRPEFLLGLGAGRFWLFPPILPGDTEARVVYLDQAGVRDEYGFALADYKAFAEKMLATARAAH